MSSDPSNGGRAPPNESPSHSSSQEMHRDAPPPPPMTAPPQTMYYPPPPGTGYPPQQPLPHQGYQPGYVARPNDQYAQPHPYHYPAGPYYNNPPPTNYNKSVGGRAFFRCFIMCCCMLFTGFFITSLLMALALHPKFPVYTVNSVSVTNFNITTPTTLTANWSTSISIHNMNEKLTVLVSDYKLDLMHKNDLIGVSFEPDFELSKNGVKQIDANPSLVGFPSPQWDIDAMAKEKESGSIMFNLRITSMIAFKSTSVSTRNTVLLALCNDLKIVFQNNTGTGTLENGGRPITCQLYM